MLVIIDKLYQSLEYQHYDKSKGVFFGFIFQKALDDRFLQ